MKTVSSLKVASRRFKSWGAFLIALAIIALAAAVFIVLIVEFVPGSVRFVVPSVFVAFITATLLLAFNEKLVVWSFNLEPITKSHDHERLWNAVNHARGSRRIPRIYLMREQGQNAFAFGIFRGAVAATTGLINNLNDDELTAVMAHEVGHLRNRDIVVSMIITSTLIFFGLLGWLVKEFSIFASSKNHRDSPGWRYLVGILIGGAIYYIGRPFVAMVRLYVSRQRELAADAISADTIGSPMPLISALKKISSNPRIGSETMSAAVGFLCTADPVSSFNDEKFVELFSTHPPMATRIRELEQLAS
ncbi:M48 family metalloprotease [bacterium]|nr:M48 family metalloprotease [bacterium]